MPLGSTATVLNQLRRRARANPVSIRSFASVLVLALIIQICPVAYATGTDPSEVLPTSSTGHQQSEHSHAGDGHRDASPCCALHPPHTHDHAQAVFLSTETELRPVSGVALAPGPFELASEPESPSARIDSIDRTATRARILYLTTLRLRI